MSDTIHQKGGAVCRTDTWQIEVYWLTLGENADFRQASKVGQYVGKSERGLAKKRAASVAKAILEEFPSLTDVIVLPRMGYGESSWLKG